MKIYIIHGWTYTLEKWDKVCQLLRQADIEPIQLHVPGLTEPSSKSWTIDEYVLWLADKLKSETSPIVIGHSNGGRIALSYCQKYPKHFKKLILIDAAGIAHDSWWPKTKLKILRTLSKIGKPLAKIPLARKVFYKVIGAQDYRNAPPNMKLTMQNMLQADNTLEPSKVRVPTTIIWGRQDKSTPLADGQKMHKLIPGSVLHIIDGAGHSPHATHADQIAQIIVETLA